MISDRRLEHGDIRGRLLLLEDNVGLTEANRGALRRYAENGGRILLTGKAVGSARLVPDTAASGSGLSRNRMGKGEVLCLARPLFPAAEGNGATTSAEETLQQILPYAERLLTTDAPVTIELVLRERNGTMILHALNIAPGQRERDPKANSFVNLRISELPSAPACRVSLRVPSQPLSLTLQPQNHVITDWMWRDGLLEFELPAFETHQLVVIQPPSAP
jgi:hypothetical protein